MSTVSNGHIDQTATKGRLDDLAVIKGSHAAHGMSYISNRLLTKSYTHFAGNSSEQS